MDYDFSGWATRNDVQCSDGRTIRKDAFRSDSGKEVPLVWNHSHDNVTNVLGHALLENRKEGVYMYGKFNDTYEGQSAKELVKNGDITALSIYANHLKQSRGDVLHGEIKEVSLVLAGANPEAYIDYVVQHGEGSEVDEAEICQFGEVFLESGKVDLAHSEDEEKGDDKMPEENGKTIEDIVNTMNEEQKQALYAIVGQALEDNGEDDEEEGDKEMKHNAFDAEYDTPDTTLSHSDEVNIMQMAKKSNVGTFQTALQYYAEENGLEHSDAIANGFDQTSLDNLYPEYRTLGPAAPELITNDQGWISTVMAKVHKNPFSRVRTQQVDIRNIDALRAKGYKKGKEKKLGGNFTLVRRTTDPQTIYVKNALHKDDIIDVTDFSIAEYLYKIDRLMLNEELATAIMLGDGRSEDDPDKIDPVHIRPIWLDDDLYTIHIDLDKEAAKKELQGTNTGANFGDNYITAEAMVNTVLYARENYKGTGTPDMYITPHMLNVMLLARDLNGRRIYSSKSELESALNVESIITCEQFEGKTRTITGGTDNGKKKQLQALICNLADYSLGSTKGGEVSHFTQFDIDFNQEKSLLETRVSGALTKVHSAIAIELDVTEAV